MDRTPTKFYGNKLGEKEPVEVYCRLRPAEYLQSERCVKLVDHKCVRLNVTDGSHAAKNGSIESIDFKFKHVFGEGASQSEVFEILALPMVTDVLQGRNNVLFTYGVTSSGKTYSMAGAKRDPGILPRSLDTIFNSISGKQACAGQVLPNKSNGFTILSDSDLLLNQAERYGRDGCFGSNRGAEAFRNHEALKIDDIDQENNYAVFVSCVEVYNNHFYDLLDKDGSIERKTLREDPSGQMFVDRCEQIAVKSSDEALAQFYQAQKARKVAHTKLNADSSRSHAVFTIRIVQARLDEAIDRTITDQSKIKISSFVLVDLAGSERAKRTDNDKYSTREAGKINSSLMSLRECMETLREIQKGAMPSSTRIPYRNTKLTHLFKSYFESQGKISLLVCINPSAFEYDENLNVLKFAEMSQEVSSAPSEKKRIYDVGAPKSHFDDLITNRKDKRQKFDKSAEKGFDFNFTVKAEDLFAPFPNFLTEDLNDRTTLPKCIEYVSKRMEACKQWFNETVIATEQFHKHFRNVVLENYTLRSVIEQYQKDQLVRDRTIDELEERVRQLRQQSISMTKNSASEKYRVDQLMENLDRSKELLERERKKRLKFEEKMRQKAFEFRCKKDTEIQTNIKTVAEDLEAQLQLREQQVTAIDKIIHNRAGGVPKPTAPSMSVTDSDDSILQHRVINRNNVATSASGLPVDSPSSRIPIVNPRYTGHTETSELVIDHIPQHVVPTGTVAQPSFLKSKQVKAMKIKNTLKADKYVLTHQEADTDGELETRLYKGDIVPTVGGGRSIVFQDVEIVKQRDPLAAPNLRRNIQLSPKSVASDEILKRCRVFEQSPLARPQQHGGDADKN